MFGTLPSLSPDLWHQVQTQVQMEYRTRFERRLDRDFDGSNPDNRSDLHQRIRIGLQYKVNENISGFLQYQYAHTLGWGVNGNGSDENSDLFQAYAQFKQPSGTFTVGRQRINVGSERLVGALEWINAARSYDGIRFENKQWDVFGARIAVQNVRPRNVRLAGVSYKSSPCVTSFIFKHDETTSGDVDIWTLSNAYRKQHGAIEWDIEAAVQGGRSQGKDLEAWAVHAQANIVTGKNSKFGVEVNSSSGGGNGSKTRTFDNLYPTNHKFYGLMDLHSWRNTDMAAVHYSSAIRKDVDFKARLATSRLHDAKDAWYGASGAPNRTSTGIFRDPTGNSGKHLGEEFDLEVTWKRSPKVSINAGVGIFKPGKFVKNLSGDDQAQLFGYLMYGVKW